MDTIIDASPEEIAIFKKSAAAFYSSKGLSPAQADEVFNLHMDKIAAALEADAATAERVDKIATALATSAKRERLNKSATGPLMGGILGGAVGKAYKSTQVPGSYAADTAAAKATQQAAHKRRAAYEQGRASTASRPVAPAKPYQQTAGYTK